MHFALLVALSCISTPEIPETPEEGYGLWLTSECEWIVVPCPSSQDFKNEDITLRLPIFCPLMMPRIGYSVKTDTAVRQDLAKASSLIPSLNSALNNCRSSQDSNMEECVDLMEQSKNWLNECVKESTLQLREVESLERGRDAYRVWAFSSTTAVAVLATILIIQSQL